MADKDERSDILKWKDRVRAAKQYQERDGRFQNWRRNRDWYRNRYPSQVVSVNLVFSYGRALVPQLYFKAPTILCRPHKQNFVQQSKILEAIDAWLIDHIGLKQQIKMVILDAFLTNVGIIKCGYNTLSTELPAPNEDSTAVVAEMLGAPTSELQEDLDRKKWSYHDHIKPNAPWALRVRPQDVLIPWGFADEHEAPWMAYKVVRPVADVKKDEAYKNTSRLQPNVVPDTGLSGLISPNLVGATSSGEFVELIEIWDKRDGTIRVLSMDHDKWLRDDEHGLEITGFPGVVLRFNPDGEDFWGVPDCEHIAKQVIELNENRTHEIVSKRLANIKGIVDTNTVDDIEIQKAEAGKGGMFIKAKGNAAAAFHQFAFTVPPDLWKVDEVIRRDVRDTLGWSRNQSGEFHPGRKTATEVETVQSAFELRSDERRDQVADMFAELFRDKIHPMIFQHWTEQRTMEVTALGGWYKFTGQEIRADYDVFVVPDSVIPMGRRDEQQLAERMFAALKGDPRIQQRPLYLYMMGAFRELIPDPESLMVPEEEYQKLVQQQQQMALLTQMMHNRGARGAVGAMQGRR